MVEMAEVETENSEKMSAAPADVESGDVIETELGDLEILEAEHTERFGGNTLHRFEARKECGHVVSLREHHVTRAFHAGAELIKEEDR